jgi:hypothetical protein
VHADGALCHASALLELTYLLVRVKAGVVVAVVVRWARCEQAQVLHLPRRTGGQATQRRRAQVTTDQQGRPEGKRREESRGSENILSGCRQGGRREREFRMPRAPA